MQELERDSRPHFSEDYRELAANGERGVEWNHDGLFYREKKMRERERREEDIQTNRQTD